MPRLLFCALPLASQPATNCTTRARTRYYSPHCKWEGLKQRLGRSPSAAHKLGSFPGANMAINTSRDNNPCYFALTYGHSIVYCRMQTRKLHFKYSCLITTNISTAEHKLVHTILYIYTDN